ncbi:hypothetical protein [Thermoactinomyces sp. DSM 45891]|uniref:hypothetical protein n=1 Tax=Thermoactinomyces sp. DSM 45891 TaxID=1761907 RepID=UPI000930C6DD|nr:hypothetical protein [Thermoactinomyces sp. DSM 45891]
MIETKNVELSPPWVTYFNEIKYSVGVDPGVTVGPLIPVGDVYLILVTVSGNEKAKAIATLLNPTKTFGNVVVFVVVIDTHGELISPLPCPLDAFCLASIFQIALTGNEFFQDVVVQPQLPGQPYAVYPVFKPEVIQFFNDDISNLCNTFTGVAASVFQDVLRNQICEVSILFSTSCDGA